MKILTLNAGSATLKYALFQMPDETVLAEGTSEHSGDISSIIAAAEQIFERCRPQGVDATGHRMVHGGAEFSQPALVTPQVLESLRGLAQFDPLHNPTELALINAARRLLPDLPAVAVFDTAFHQTLPEVAWRYAVPRGLSERLGLRRYGFHGLSHRYVSERLLQRLGRGPGDAAKLITCHLGSGASLCAVQDGRSIDTSMGLTPLEGLVMGTRSGDVDPGLLLYLLRSQNMAPTELDDLLNHQSGLLGLSGRSGDVRALEQAAGSGDAPAEMALEVFAYRVRKYIGAYAAALGGIDALALTGGIGEHSAPMRARICRGLEFLGIRLDPHKNEAAREETEIGIGGSQVWMIPTDEARQIARETAALLGDNTPGTKHK